MSFLIGVKPALADRRQPAFAPLNYGMVTDHLHRSAMPEPRHFGFLELLGIRSVIVLSPAAPSPELARWAADNGVRLLHPHSVQASKTTSLSEQAAAELVSLLLSHTLPAPALVTCPSGRYRTGLVVGCLRKAQQWNTAAILDEYRRFAEGRARLENEDFMEMFDVSLVSTVAYGSSTSTAAP
jgi:protein tyrosine/serine phosphatase